MYIAWSMSVVDIFCIRNCFFFTKNKLKHQPIRNNTNSIKRCRKCLENKPFALGYSRTRIAIVSAKLAAQSQLMTNDHVIYYSETSGGTADLL